MTRPYSKDTISRRTATDMPEVLKSLVATDKLIHEPSRLAVLSYLELVTEADFMTLVHVTGLSRGNLTIQLDKLEDGCILQTERVIRNRRTRRTARLTSMGSKAIKQYWDRMETFRDRLSKVREAGAYAEDSSMDEEGRV